MLPTLSPQDFVAKWRQATLKERSAAQEHFIDLCHLVGHPTPAEADPTGQSFTFEAGATKQRGGQGWADVWKRGHFAWEYKGKHKDLDRAYQQLLQYRESLLNPPLLVVSDTDQIVVHTNFTNTVKQIVRIRMDDLLTPQGLAHLRAVFFEPDAFRAPQTTEQVTQEAAGEFAHLADLLRKYGADPQQASHFLIRLLFCLFAEDIGLLPQDLFTRLVEQTHRNSAAFAGQLRQLFQAMTTGGWFGADKIVNFDGQIFDDDSVLELDSDGLDILVRVSRLDWSNIEPSIFGTLFERSLDPAKRSQLGAHYTSREDILLIVEPVLMAPLRRRWEEVRQEALDLARRRDEAQTRRIRDNRNQELTALLTGFGAELAQVRVLDAACGSGNFLYVALKLLLDLWKEVSTLARDLGLPLMSPLPTLAPSPAQLHGIEISAHAHALAQATIWIGYIQWLHDNGFGAPGEPILKPLDTILLMDAILAYDEQGQPVEPEWPEADVVIGNPPFLGGKKMRAELGDAYAEDLFTLYSNRVPAFADLVCYWFERTRALIETDKLQRAGLLATNSIRSGLSRKVLDQIKETGDIFMAWDDRPWILDGAAVRVSIIGFDDGTQTRRRLNGMHVARINADLTSTVDLTMAASLVENEGICLRADEKGGSFDIPGEVAQRMLEAPLNVNGRPNSDVILPWATGRDIVQRPRNIWIIDFGVDTSIEDAAQYELPFSYVEMHVKPIREKNRIARLREKWWLHRVPGANMRTALSKLSRFIATPVTAKYRIFVWLENPILPDITLAVFTTDDDYYFGALHSRPHEIWSLRMGAWMGQGNDPRYTPTSTFQSFPFPWPPGQEPQDDRRVQAIAQAARELVEKRDRWLNPEGATEQELKKRTLTNLYNARPTWLALAHRELDEAVLEAYGWPHDWDDEEILERLLALNLERAGA